MPHKVTRDDVYNGYLIPAGCTVYGNAWAILHDPDVFPEPECFRPERFLQSKREDTAGRANPAMDPERILDMAFGFGRTYGLAAVLLSISGGFIFML